MYHHGPCVPSRISQLSSGRKELVNCYSVPCSSVAYIQRTTVMQRMWWFMCVWETSRPRQGTLPWGGDISGGTGGRAAFSHSGGGNPFQLASSSRVGFIKVVSVWLMLVSKWPGSRYFRHWGEEWLRLEVFKFWFFTKTWRCSFLQVRWLL